MNVGDTVEITVASATDEHVILDVYRFIGEGSTADLPGLAATPELAYDQFYLFGIAEVWLWTPPNSEGGELHHDFDTTQPSDEPFVLQCDRDYGFICWSAPGQIADITSGVAAEEGSPSRDRALTTKPPASQGASGVLASETGTCSILGRQSTFWTPNQDSASPAPSLASAIPRYRRRPPAG